MLQATQLLPLFYPDHHLFWNITNYMAISRIVCRFDSECIGPSEANWQDEEAGQVKTTRR